MPSQTEMRDVVQQFPEVFAQAIEDWAKFREGLRAGVVPANVKSQVYEWYNEFPKLWQGIRVNWEQPDSSQADRYFVAAVDRFIIRLRAPSDVGGLGIAPLIILGILVAGAFGVAGLTWAVGYLKKQRNISQLIDATVAGKVPVTTLNKAIEEDKQSFLGKVSSTATNIAMLGVLALLGFMLLPVFTKGRN